MDLENVVSFNVIDSSEAVSNLPARWLSLFANENLEQVNYPG